MKYHVRYIEDCSPKLKSFKTKTELNKFLASFINKHGSLDDKGDNWVEFSFKGEFIKINKGKL